MIAWIPYDVERAQPGDEDLLTEIQGIESLRRPLFDFVTNILEHEVVVWLQVSSDSFLEVERKVIP